MHINNKCTIQKAAFVAIPNMLHIREVVNNAQSENGTKQNETQIKEAINQQANMIMLRAQDVAQKLSVNKFFCFFFSLPFKIQASVIEHLN